MIEPFTVHSRYNVQGLSDMLKMNQQFTTMCQKLMLKYNCYDATPIEWQMVMIISTSVYLTILKNNAKPAMNEFFNQKI